MRVVYWGTIYGGTWSDVSIVIILAIAEFNLLTLTYLVTINVANATMVVFIWYRQRQIH